MLIANIIGAGNLGKTLGFLFRQQEIFKIGGVLNTTYESALSAVHFIGDGTACASMADLPPADFIFITTPDDCIQTLCEALSRQTQLKKKSIIVHCSGVLASDILSSAKKNDCYIASVHPMRSFANPALSITQYDGTYCAIEGDKIAVQNLNDLFNRIGSVSYVIDRNKKALYHASGVFASNYLVTLAQQALSCLESAGIEKEMAMGIITHLMKGTVCNLESTLSPDLSLTGPIKRGDSSTIKKHMDAFQNAGQKQLYIELGKATVPIASLVESKQHDVLKTLIVD